MGEELDNGSDDLSERRRARDELGIDATAARALREQTIAYAARDFVLCGLPFRRPRGGHVYRRHNGDTTLELTGHPVHGLPYGQDRLIPIWLATAFFAADKPADNVIRFRCVTDILRAFGLETDGGKNLARLRDRLLRIFWCQYAVWLRPRNGKEPSHDATIHKVMRSMRINMLEDHKRAANQYTLWMDKIELDPRFAEDLRRGGRVPVDFETIRALKDCAPALDLYIWQAWRSYRAMTSHKAAAAIPIFGEGGLMAQLGSDTNEPKKVRQLLRRWQADVKRVWPECPNYLDAKCERFVINAGAAVTISARLPILPGVSPKPPAVREMAGPDRPGVLVAVREDESALGDWQDEPLEN